MCGIAGFHIKENVELTKKDWEKCELMLDELLLGIESRGHDATGFVAVTQESKKAILDKKAVTASEFIRGRKTLPPDVKTVLAHTRWETKGTSEHEYNNHPVVYGSTFVTHNGTVRNDDAVFKSLDLKRNAEVDSEAIAAALHKFGFAKADKAIAELTGGFAVAAVNPIQNKNTVLLFKGNTWPIAYYDDKKVFIWASEHGVIKDAWKKVMEQELDFSDTKSFFDGDIMVIEGAKITKKVRPPAVTHRYAGQHQAATRESNTLDLDEYWEGYENRESACGVKPWTIRNSRNERPPEAKVKLNCYEQTRKLRTDGKGKARTFSQRKELVAGEEKIDLKWFLCSSCRTTILAGDMVDHKLYGRICIDCNPAKELEISREEVEKLEDFVDMENFVYEETLELVKNETGISIPAIDYLMSRAKLDHSSGQFRALHKQVKEVFDKKHKEAWISYADFMAEKNEEKEERTGNLTDPALFWVSCNGDVHRSDEPCDNCQGLLEIKDKSQWEKDKDKRVKEAQRKNEAMLCSHCDKRWKIEVNFKGKMIRWCHKCYAHCAFKEEKCPGKPVGFDESGKRWCHKHYRGKKGGRQDSKVGEKVVV